MTKIKPYSYWRLLHPAYSLRARLLWSIGIIGIALALLNSYLVGSATIDQVRADKGLLVAELAQQMADEMDKGVFERLREIGIVASLETIRDPKVPLGQKQALLEKLQASYENYAWIGLTDEKGNIVVGTGGLLVGKNVEKRAWFMQGSQGPHVGDVHDAFLLAKLLPKPKHDFLPLRLLDVSAPVYDTKGKLLGVLCGHLSWDWSFEVRNDLIRPLKAETHAEVLITNREGKLLLGTPQLSQLSPTLTVPSLKAATGQGHGYLTERWPDGGEYLTGYAASTGHRSYGGLGWTVLVREPTAYAFAEADNLRRLELAAGLVFATGFAALLWIVVGRLTGPTRAIAQAAERIREGDPEARIPLVAGKDEAALLATSLASMVESLRSMGEQMRLSAQVFRSSTEGIIITDAEERILSVNQAFTDITGYSEEEVAGQRPTLLGSGRQSPEFYKEMWRTIRSNGRWQGEIWNRRKNGEVYPEWLIITTVYDPQRRVSHYIGIFADITERKRAEERMTHLAHHDGLTNLPNRIVYFDRLEQAMRQAERHGGRVAVLFIDLDRFKNINDTLGHDVGDQLLVEVARRLQGCMRSVDTLARLGGDEFVAVMTVMERPEEAAQLASRFIHAFAEPFSLAHDYQLTITASVGIAVFPDDGPDVYELTRRADTAMFHAKSFGRNNYQFFTPVMDEQVKERLLLENGLRRALKEGELFLEYQPLVDLASGTIRAVEALARWESRELGSVSPARFIPIAEETGLIGELGRWVLAEACRQHRRWREAGLALRMSVNLSSVQFQDPRLAEQIEQIIRDTGMPPQQLELEITESVLVGSEQDVIATIERLHRLGVGFAVDDFGTGYSNLYYLAKLPIDALKIDRSFVRDLGNSSEAGTIVDTIVMMAQQLRLRLVAEGIEEPHQLAFLKRGGCIEGQGYLFSRPLKPEQIVEFASPKDAAKAEQG